MSSKNLWEPSAEEIRIKKAIARGTQSLLKSQHVWLTVKCTHHRVILREALDVPRRSIAFARDYEVMKTYLKYDCTYKSRQSAVSIHVSASDEGSWLCTAGADSQIEIPLTANVKQMCETARRMWFPDETDSS